MKPLRFRLQEARRRTGLPWDIMEKDYLLSWVLAGIGRNEALRNTLVFKGGTALKKCYFGDYRFSEDLDFSAVDQVPRGNALEEAVNEACREAVRLLDPYAPVNILCERYTEKEPHPGGQEAFTVRAGFPWHRAPHARVMVEMSVDEPVIKPPEKRVILHEYGEPLDTPVLVYSLEEIVAEKLRAVLQHAEKLQERGWSRSRARDYYDLWRILGASRDTMDLRGFRLFLREKCRVRGVTFEGPEDFFQEEMISHVERTWEQWLGPLVPDLPAFRTVRKELFPRIEGLVS